MKYNLFINQKAIMKLTPEMNLFESIVLDVVIHLCNSKSDKIQRINVNDQLYTWINLLTIFKEIPLLKKHIKTTGTLSRILSTLERYNYIKRYHQNIRRKDGKLNNKLYVSLTEKVDLLMSDKKPETVFNE